MIKSRLIKKLMGLQLIAFSAVFVLLTGILALTGVSAALSLLIGILSGIAALTGITMVIDRQIMRKTSEIQTDLHQRLPEVSWVDYVSKNADELDHLERAIHSITSALEERVAQMKMRRPMFRRFWIIWPKG